MGAAALAETQDIADFAYLLDETYGWFDGYLHAKANYQLVVDNLLDLTHTEFLHPLLKSDGYNARHEQRIEQSGDSIVIYNHADDDNILPIMAQLKPHMGKIGRSLQMIRWELPSLLHLSIEYYSGTDDFIIPSGHFLTPETEFSTHYFTRGGQSIDPGNVAFTEGIETGCDAYLRNRGCTHHRGPAAPPWDSGPHDPRPSDPAHRCRTDPGQAAVEQAHSWRKPSFRASPLSPEASRTKRTQSFIINQKQRSSNDDRKITGTTLQPRL